MKFVDKSVEHRTLVFFYEWRRFSAPNLSLPRIPEYCPSASEIGELCRVCFGGYIRQHQGRKHRIRRGVCHCVGCKCPHLIEPKSSDVPALKREIKKPETV